MSKLFSFQGSLYSAIRDTVTGKPTDQVWLGNAPTVQLKLAAETSKKTESFSGTRGTYGTNEKSRSATLSVTLDEWLSENIALGLYATRVAQSTGSVTAESLPPGIAAGDIVQLDSRFISSLVLTDSAGSPTTLTGTHYKLLSDAAGLVKFLSVSGLTQPFKAAYSKAAAESYAMLMSPAPERYLILDGINTETNAKVVVELYRCKFSPIGQLDLINEDYGNLPMEAEILLDELNGQHAELGNYGRIIQATA